MTVVYVCSFFYNFYSFCYVTLIFCVYRNFVLYEGKAHHLACYMNPTLCHNFVLTKTNLINFKTKLILLMLKKWVKFLIWIDVYCLIRGPLNECLYRMYNSKYVTALYQFYVTFIENIFLNQPSLFKWSHYSITTKANKILKFDIYKKNLHLKTKPHDKINHATLSSTSTGSIELQFITN